MSTVAGTPQPANPPAAALPQPANSPAATPLQPANPPTAALPQPANPPAAGPGSMRAIWVALFLVFGIILGTAAGAVALAGGLNIPGALGAFGGAFSATVLLSIALYNFASGNKSN